LPPEIGSSSRNSDFISTNKSLDQSFERGR
jgi:hypothetical protein